MKLQGKVAIITGSTKGIGLGIAKVFASEGAMITVVSHEDGGEQIVEMLRSLGAADALFVLTDVRDSAQIGHDRPHNRALGRLDILVNNVGYHISKNVEQTSEQEWEFLVATNLRSTFLCSKYAVPHLKNGPKVRSSTSVPWWDWWGRLTPLPMRPQREARSR